MYLCAMNESLTEFTIVVKTIPGLEPVLMQELISLGCKDITEVKRGATLRGGLETVYMLNYQCRSAIRVLINIGSFEVTNQDELYKGIKQMNWLEHLSPSQTLAIDSTSFNNEAFTNTMFISQKAKDAIVDQIREKTGKRPSVDTQNADLRINIYISQQLCTVSLDSSGNSLHVRGYKEETVKAPMNEVLASGLLMLAGWNGDKTLVDPMCGSGTFLTEGVMIATNTPPGFYRKNFGFQNWRNYNKDLWKSVKTNADKAIKPLECKLAGYDKDPRSTKAARANLEAIGAGQKVQVVKAMFETLRHEFTSGMLILNPPYGERLDSTEDITALYKMIGDKLKKDFQGFEAWIITSTPEGMKSVGLRPSRKLTVFNGQLECRFLKYELYGGSKKLKKQVQQIPVE